MREWRQVDMKKQLEKAGKKYRFEGRIDASIWSTQRRFLQIDFHVIGGGRCCRASLGFCCIQKHFEWRDGMKLRRLLINFAWNRFFH